MLRFFRVFTRLLLAALFLLAGTVHLRDPGLFLQVMPPAIPFPNACVIISGMCELLGGSGLLIPLRPVQLLTGWGLTPFQPLIMAGVLWVTGTWPMNCSRRQ
jgi:uncharacterized membrane protein